MKPLGPPRGWPKKSNICIILERAGDKSDKKADWSFKVQYRPKKTHAEKNTAKLQKRKEHEERIRLLMLEILEDL